MNPAEMSLRLLLCSRLSEDQRRLAEHYAQTDSGTGHEKTDSSEGRESGGLLRCARIVSDVLGAESFAVIGGLALSAFGYVRVTLVADVSALKL